MERSHLDYDESEIDSTNVLFASAVGNNNDGKEKDDYTLEMDEAHDSLSDDEIDNIMALEVIVEDERNVLQEDETNNYDIDEEREVMKVDEVGNFLDYELFSDMSWAKDAIVNEGDDRDTRNTNEGLHIGMSFEDKDELKRAVREFSLKHRANYTVIKSTKKLYLVECKHRVEKDCKWYVRAIIGSNNCHFTITRRGPDHSCKVTKMMSSSMHLDINMIAHRIRDKIKARTTFFPSHIIEEMKLTFGFKINYKTAWRARLRALEMIFGGYRESFNLLPRYLQMVQETNQDSKVEWKTRPGNDGETIVEQVFWSFGPAIKAFEHCPPVLSIDGTHLYGKYKGVILVAIAMDASHKLLPVAFALAQSECNENWDFFLKNIHALVKERDNVCIISDRHNGIINAMRKPEWSNAYHRFCLRHVQSNFNTRVKNEKLKKFMGKCARAKQVCKTDNLLSELEMMCGDNTQAKEWLDNLDLERWTLAYDKGGRRYGSMTTNAVECFNSVLKGCRDLPITAIVQFTLQRTNMYFVRNRKEYASLNPSHKFVPLVQDKIDALIQRGARHEVTAYDEELGVYEVLTKVFWEENGEKKRTNGKHTQTVCLKERYCSCGKWTQTHYPCSHVLAVTIQFNMDYQDLVCSTFTSNALVRTWAPTFTPIPDPRTWPPYDCGKYVCDESYIRTTKGRPNTKRRKNEMDHGVPNVVQCSQSGATQATQNSNASIPSKAPRLNTASCAISRDTIKGVASL